MPTAFPSSDKGLVGREQLDNIAASRQPVQQIAVSAARMAGALGAKPGDVLHDSSFIGVRDQSGPTGGGRRRLVRLPHRPCSGSGRTLHGAFAWHCYSIVGRYAQEAVGKLVQYLEECCCPGSDAFGPDVALQGFEDKDQRVQPFFGLQLGERRLECRAVLCVLRVTLVPSPKAGDGVAGPGMTFLPCHQ